VRVNSGTEIVAEEVSNRPGINKTDLLDAVRARIPGHNQDHVDRAIKEAARAGDQRRGRHP
jgi:glutamate-1-semialdehyde aminotransferase